MIQGGAGHDMLQGGGGNDVLNGSDDDDVDYLNGSTGDDVIIAGHGDVVNSGSGADRIVTDTDNAIEVDDYDPANDTLEIVYEDDAPTLTTTIMDDNLPLMADDTTVATLYGIDSLDISTVRLVPAG